MRIHKLLLERLRTPVMLIYDHRVSGSRLKIENICICKMFKYVNFIKLKINRAEYKRIKRTK